MEALLKTPYSLIYVFLWLLAMTACQQAASCNEAYVPADGIADTTLANASFDAFPATIAATSPGFNHTGSHGTYHASLPGMFFPLIEPERIELPDEEDGALSIAIYHTSRKIPIQSRTPAVVNLSMMVYSYPPDFFEGMSSEEVLEEYISSYVEGTPGMALIDSRPVTAGTLRGMEAEFVFPVQHYGTTYSKLRIFRFGDDIVMLHIVGGGVINGAEPDEVFSDSVGTAFLGGFVYTPF